MDRPSVGPWTDPGQDPELLKQAQRGDLPALLRLFNTHRLLLWRTCLVITRHPGEAERLFQETLACATRELPSAPADQSLLPWLARIARDLDGERARTRLVDPAAGAPHRPNGRAWDSTARNARDIDVEQRALLGYSLLHAEDQWILALRVVEGLSYADIARVTGHPVERVEERVALARGYVDQVCAAEDRAA